MGNHLLLLHLFLQFLQNHEDVRCMGSIRSRYYKYQSQDGHENNHQGIPGYATMNDAQNPSYHLCQTNRGSLIFFHLMVIFSFNTFILHKLNNVFI